MSAPVGGNGAPPGAARDADGAKAERGAARDATLSGEWPLWEIFIRSQHGLAHKHVGSLHAVDTAMAMQNARDVYTRRNEGVSIWVVRSMDIHASPPDARDALFAPANDKIYRHPTFFPMPDEVKHL